MGISLTKKKLLCEFQDYKCEQCHKKYSISKLEVHRINPGYKGGTYSDHRNLKVVCSKCHDVYSSAERIASGIQ